MTNSFKQNYDHVKSIQKKVFTSNLLKQKYLYQIPSNKSIQDQSF